MLSLHHLARLRFHISHWKERKGRCDYCDSWQYNQQELRGHKFTMFPSNKSGKTSLLDKLLTIVRIETLFVLWGLLSNAVNWWGRKNSKWILGSSINFPVACWESCAHSVLILQIANLGFPLPRLIRLPLFPRPYLYDACLPPSPLQILIVAASQPHLVLAQEDRICGNRGPAGGPPTLAPLLGWLVGWRGGRDEKGGFGMYSCQLLKKSTWK